MSNATRDKLADILWSIGLFFIKRAERLYDHCEDCPGEPHQHTHEEESW